MMKAIRAALDPSDSQEHVRIVAFMTDGYVGNDMEIIGEVRKHPNARVFSFGIGGSVNRFLLDKMAEEGRGEVEYVALNDDGSSAARRFHERVRNPLLTDISIDWGGLPVNDVYPRRIPDLFSAKPVTLAGRYDAPARAVIRLRGKMSGREVVRTIAVDLPGTAPGHDVLATLWARRKVEDLMAQDWQGVQRGNPAAGVRDAVTSLGLEFRLMTQFTSFVAVEETVVTEGGAPVRVDVPVEMPEGVSYEGVFGNETDAVSAAKLSVAPLMTHREAVAGGVGRSAPRQAVSRDEAKAAAGEPGSRLHPDLAALAAGRTVAGLAVREGKVEVEIWLEEAAPAVLAALKALGFEITVQPRIAKVVIGRLPVVKLEAAARLAGVRFLSPFRGR
jgi:Ca-activated chloride channel family protein